MVTISDEEVPLCIGERSAAPLEEFMTTGFAPFCRRRERETFFFPEVYRCGQVSMLADLAPRRDGFDIVKRRNLIFSCRRVVAFFLLVLLGFYSFTRWDCRWALVSMMRSLLRLPRKLSARERMSHFFCLVIETDGRVYVTFLHDGLLEMGFFFFYILVA